MVTLARVDPDGFYLMSDLELSSGWIGGTDPPADEPNEPSSHPLDTLKAILRQALKKRPCIVAFSGGRDSSAILALAVDVARREGLPLPVPVTNVYPDVPETDESRWQELVVRHLALTEWERLVYHDEADLIGPMASEGLRRSGVVWPVTVHLNERLWAAAGGGMLITGEGGDEVFGVRRITPLTGLLSRSVHPRRKAAQMAAVGVAPSPLRRRLLLPRIERATRRDWLMPAARREFIDRVIADALAEPLRWDRSIVSLQRRRGIRIGLHNLQVGAARQGATYVYPLLDTRFVHSWAGFGGRLGYPGRAAAMRTLFAPFLPEALLERADKVSFVNARLGEASRSFIAEWGGAGVDPGLVDVERLKELWSAPVPHSGTLLLLQAAWLRTTS